MKRKLKFQQLFPQHKLSKALLASYAESATVRLDAHHQPPVDFSVHNENETHVFEVKWDSPVDEELRRTYANDDDAKRDGAYAMALAAVEKCRDLVGVHRCETKTGADYYVAPRGPAPSALESALRLEVSGTDGDEREVRRRLTRKKEQAKAGASDLPALAAVVGFRTRLILLDKAT